MGALAQARVEVVPAPMSRGEAEDLAWTVYGTVAPAVVELLLLTNSDYRGDRYRALRPLEWFNPTAIETPAAPAVPTHPQGEVESAIEALKWTIYGWSYRSRAAAARRFGEIITDLAERTS